MLKHLREEGVRGPVEIIPHGVDLTRFHPAEETRELLRIREQLGLDGDSEVVLFVGPIQRRKGLDLLAEAWRKVSARRPHARLLLVGPEGIGDSKEGTPFGEAIRMKLLSHEGGHRVAFLGPVDEPEMYMKAADVFVFPSLREGMPNVVGEAFASGLACVLTPFLGLSEEFGRSGREYVLAYHDGDAIADALLCLLTDKARRRKLGNAARSWAEEHMNVDRSLDRWAELCRTLASAAGRDAGR